MSKASELLKKLEMGYIKPTIESSIKYSTCFDCGLVLRLESSEKFCPVCNSRMVGVKQDANL